MNIHQQIYPITALLIALFLFTVGRFGFFDILGLKRPLEMILFFPLFVVSFLALLIYPHRLFSPFILLLLSYLIVQLSWNIDILELFDLSCSLLVISLILLLGRNFSDLLLLFLIRVATIFAVLGIIEFIIMLIYPPLATKILLFYTTYSGSKVPLVENPYQLLGLADGTSYHLWGYSVTRLRSFASEPSLLVGYFLVPGALALSFPGRYIWYGLLCITFCILSLAGSVFLALGFTLLVFLLSLFRNRMIINILPLIVLVVFIWILNNHYNELIGFSRTTSGGYDFLDKTHSANMRFGYIRDHLSEIMFSPLGFHQEIIQPLGLLLISMAKGGLLGLFMMIIILIDMFLRLSKLIIAKKDIFKKIGMCIIYGALTAGIIYLDNCFIQLYGITLLLITYNRLRQRF